MRHGLPASVIRAARAAQARPGACAPARSSAGLTLSSAPPPSQATTAPDTYDAYGDARKSARFEMSSVVPKGWLPGAKSDGLYEGVLIRGILEECFHRRGLVVCNSLKTQFVVCPDARCRAGNCHDE